MQHLVESFDSNICLKCEKMVQTESEQRLHLVEKHGILSSQINIEVETILCNQNKTKQKSSPDYEINEQDIHEASIDLWDEELKLSDDEMFTELFLNWWKSKASTRIHPLVCNKNVPLADHWQEKCRDDCA